MEKYFPLAIIITSGLVRLIPHVSNFSPIYGTVNYSYSMIKNSFLSTLAVLAMLYITDVMLSLFKSDIYPLYGWWLLYVYPTHMINGFISKLLVKEPNQIVNIGVTCTLTSFNFFMLSNFGYFVFSQDNHTALGLRKVYLDAIPFFPLQIASNFVFTMLFFGLHNMLFKRAENIKITSDMERGSTERLIVNSTSSISH